MRLRGGVELEEMTEIDDDDLGALQKAVDKLKADKSLLNVPEMKFFRDYLLSMGATLPRVPTSTKTHT